ncbi:hypothetical protein [Mycobacterium sp. PSTR-4-N]|uniref:hypothetical protein n=1 Tax=Mycobacterium sp. PSTR-4-N TaxID=2917745 RepID=UPI001F14B011|nr:hypothetical protein [Mycobacterium sp. PSTR-4-N]MCG7593217.1 hypothetical protein [Mycobacterium sp. PSTR-4-N]
MFYKRPPRTLDHRFFRLLREAVAGIHAANGIAHGVAPASTSAARGSEEPSPR